MGQSRILLVDNGSYEPKATLALRGLAAEVSRLVRQPVHPVSVMHSTKVDPALLDGKPAVIFEDAVRQAKADGIDELIVLPLFIGPSRAITEYLPKVFAEANAGSMKLTIRPTLFGDDGAELQGMLVDNLRNSGWKPSTGTVLLCDHGSPIPEVTACRNKLADGLRAELGLSADELIACSMERREGKEYDFNEPLLETALQKAKGDAVVLMLFLLPGRHAGPEGDVATIAKQHAPTGVRWKLSPLLGEHPDLPALLESRLEYVPIPPQQLKVAAYLAIGLILALPIGLKWVLPVALQGAIPRLIITLLIVIPGLLYWASRPRKP